MGNKVPPIDLKIKRVDGDLPLPAYATENASGLDLLAAIKEDIVLKPSERILVPTGISIELPSGYEAQVRSRSGLAIKHGICCLNSPGTIDSDYRGEIKVILINLGSEPVTIKRSDRIAQLVIAPTVKATLHEVTNLSETRRGSGGFGHTGISDITRSVVSILLFLLLPTLSFAGIDIEQYTVAAGIMERKPSLVGDTFLNNIGKLHFFTKVKYSDWNESTESYITHVWYYKNEKVSVMKLKIGAPVWRTYSTKSIPQGAVGEWRVESMDENRNIFASQTFHITGQGS